MIIRHLRRAVGVLLASVVAWLPWPFGGVVPAAVAATGVAVALVAALAVASLFRLPSWRVLRPFGAVAQPVGALAALALLAAFQTLPLPVEMVSWLSEDRAERAREVAALLDEPSNAEGVRVPLSYAAEASARTGWLLAALMAALLAAALVGGDRRVRRVLGVAFVATASAQVVVGARRWFARETELWGVSIPGQADRLSGTFVNPDHLATYLEITLAVTFAWGWWALGRSRKESSMERRLLLVAPPTLVGALLFAGLAFTGSRAGLVAACLGLAAQAVLSTRAARRRSGRRAPRLVVGAVAGLLVVALALGWVAWLGVEEGFGRFVSLGWGEVSWGDRGTVYRGLPALFADAPWFGVGFGAFREVFPRVQPPDLANAWRHAHSDWLELPVVGGLVGFLVALAGLVALVRRLLDRLRRGLRSEDRATALAALGALVSVGLHELVDFGLTMPANSFTMVILCGVAAVVHGRRKRDD